MAQSTHDARLELAIASLSAPSRSRLRSTRHMQHPTQIFSLSLGSFEVVHSFDERTPINDALL